VGAPGTDVLLLPWPVFISIAPDAWPNKPLTAASFKDTAAVLEYPSSILIHEKAIAPDAGSVMVFVLLDQ
jgi:hypothetical protein